LASLPPEPGLVLAQPIKQIRKLDRPVITRVRLKKPTARKKSPPTNGPQGRTAQGARSIAPDDEENG
jgi:hypothetical protein